MESALRRAIENAELSIAYQPIVHLHDGRPCGFEALVRWTDQGQPVAPAEFIPLAEETGLVVQLGEWVLKTAVRRATHLSARAGRPLAMSVNVSRRQLQTGDLAKTVSDLLEETGFPPALLKLEITESAIMEDPDAARRVMGRLRAIGVQLQIDDFGTGYSSLGALSHFPITGIKLDRSFIQEMHDDSRPQAIIRALLRLASDLRLDCVAEGLETIEQIRTLRELGCPFAQGYYFARPMTADAVDDYLHRTIAA
jgi:EAL domain-containing protein (putative c-di-GMP-specific phosphodiesterase class I)